MREVVVNDDYSYLKLDPERPVLFLDLCGVLNNVMSSAMSWYPETVERRWLKNDHVESHKADLLFALLKHRDVQVVIVSSWVRPYLPQTAPEIQELIKFFDYPNILGSTVTGGGPERCRSVIECVNWHGLDRWAILDDSDSMYDLSALGPSRLFSPHGRYGLTDQLLEELDNQALTDAPDEVFVAP